MAARGTAAKEEILNKLLEIYAGRAQVIDKVLRISFVEDNTPVEIKVTLTAAKDCQMNLSENGDAAAAGEADNISNIEIDNNIAPTEEEQAKVSAYIEQLEKLGMI